MFYSWFLVCIFVRANAFANIRQCDSAKWLIYSKLWVVGSNPAGITSAMRNKKATRKSGFCCKSDYGSLLTNSRSYNKKCRTKYGFLVAHCRGFQGKDAVKRSGCVNPAIGNVCALSAEDPKGKALSGADLGLRSSQSRRNHERNRNILHPYRRTSPSVILR